MRDGWRPWCVVSEGKIVSRCATEWAAKQTEALLRKQWWELGISTSVLRVAYLPTDAHKKQIKYEERRMPHATEPKGDG